jgi:hypothetical protein
VAGTPLHPQYSGSMALENCTFLFVPNDIQYTLNGAFEPDGERIRVTDAVIRNLPADEEPGRKGEIHVTGDFALRDFIPGDFRLSATGALLVVKETSRLSSLSLYGNLFTEIGQGGLRFTGNVDSSMLRGSVIISNSSLVFPPTVAAVEEESPLSIPLVFVNDTMHARAAAAPRELASYFGADSVVTGGEGDLAGAPSKSFLDGMKYDLDIETAGSNTQIRMIFNAITSEELVAYIDGKFNITGDGRQWFGDLTVNRAYYNFFKRFNAEGTIHYRGNVLNPELDIQATYAAQRSDTAASGGKENVVVTFKITGTRLEPKADISMTIDGEDYNLYNRGPTSHDVQSDAIQFIVYGNFPLTAPQRAEAGTNIGSTVSISLLTGASSLLTGTLSEFLRRQTGFINSVEFSYNGGLRNTVGESADIRLTGVAWSGIWRYGGKILDKPLSNANFSIQYSFGTIFDRPSLRNLMIELERKVETNTLSTTDEMKQTNSLRLFYRFSF